MFVTMAETSFARSGSPSEASKEPSLCSSTTVWTPSPQIFLRISGTACTTHQEVLRGKKTPLDRVDAFTLAFSISRFRRRYQYQLYLGVQRWDKWTWRMEPTVCRAINWTRTAISEKP